MTEVDVGHVFMFTTHFHSLDKSCIYKELIKHLLDNFFLKNYDHLSYIWGKKKFRKIYTIVCTSFFQIPLPFVHPSANKLT
jgi:hypothetical protein